METLAKTIVRGILHRRCFRWLLELIMLGGEDADEGKRSCGGGSNWVGAAFIILAIPLTILFSPIIIPACWYNDRRKRRAEAIRNLSFHMANSPAPTGPDAAAVLGRML